MRVYLKPLLPIVDGDRIEYEFEEKMVTAHYNGKTDTFDFSEFGEGELQLIDENGEETIKTTLDIQPIMSAKIEKGVLHVKLINFVPSSAPKNLNFPEWIDHTEYEPPAKEDSNGEDEMETES